MMKKIALSVCMLLAASATNAFAGDAAAGKAKSGLCAGCHGADGNSAIPTFPSLAGQHGSYIAKQLADFKLGKERSDATMAGMVAALSEQDMKDLGAYFASQNAKGLTADPEQVELGKQIYKGGNTKSGVPACMACHSPNGMGNEAAKFPRLSGQHATYTEKALKDFRSGARANDAGQMMRNIAAKMTDAEIKAVSEYVAGLR